MKSREYNIFAPHGTLTRSLPLIVFLFLWVMPVCAQLKVFPEYVFMSSSERAGKLTVSNPFTSTVECWVEVSYGYPRMADSGKVQVVKDSTAANNMVSWIRTYPKRFVLDENESQLIRFMIAPPVTPADGEYWARIAVFSKPSKPVNKKSPSGAGTAIVQISSIDVPLHYRVGRVSTGVDFSNPLVTYLKDSRKIHFSVDIKHSGNAATWGSMNLVLVDRKNNLALKADRHFVSYCDYRFMMDVDAAKVPPGTYTLRATVGSTRDDLSSKFILPFKSPETILDLTIP